MENTTLTTETTGQSATAPETQPAAVPEKPAVQPEYNLKAPEGALLNPKRLDEIATFARERGLSPEHAQALVEQENGLLVAQQQAEQERFAQARVQWAEQLKNDKQYGGENYNRTVENARRALAAVGDPELVSALKSGLGDFPGLIKTMAKIYEKFMAEDTIMTRVVGSSKPQTRSIEDIFYGPTKE